MRRAALDIGIAATALVLVPSIAQAEVSDKIPSVGFLWLASLAFVGVALLLARLRWWLPAVLVPVTLVFVLALADQMRDPYLRAAIWAEQGWPYVASVYGSCALFVVVQVAALWIGRGWHRAKRART
jgi:hypothetical protein